MSCASERLREFHEAFGVRPDGRKTVAQREGLHIEEHDELIDALTDLWDALDQRTRTPERESREAVADELADVMVIAYGTADLLGIDLDRAFAIKMDANMAKLPDCPNPRCDDGDVPGGAKGHLLCPDCGGTGKGKPIKNDQGKVLKPPGWQKPSMAEAILPSPPASYSDSVATPDDLPSVQGTNVTRPI